MKMERMLTTVAVILTVIVGHSIAQGATLNSIGVLDPANPASTVNAVTPDGVYAAGYSKNGTDSYPVLWSSSGGLVQLPNAAGTSPNLVTEARGVIVRSGGTGNPDVIGIAGHASTGWAMQYYEAPANNVTSGTWTDADYNYTVGPYNAARLSTGGSQWYIAGQQVYNSKAVRQRVNPPIAADWSGGNGEQVANSVSANSVGIGYHSPGSSHAAAYWNIVNNTAGFHAIPDGGAGAFSEGLGISTDGNVMCGLVGTSTTSCQGFIWTIGDAAMTTLPALSGDTLSVAIAVNAGKIAIGYSSDGTNERAVVWDTAGQPKLVTGILSAAGVDTSAWTQLSRATSISNDGKIIAGSGIWAADGSTRGFIADISAAPGVPPVITAAKSVKTHGTAGSFSIDVFAAGAVEDRQGGPTEIVVTFNEAIQLVGLNPVVVSSGTVTSANVSGTGNDTLTVVMSGAVDAMPFMVTFPGVADAKSPTAVCTGSLCFGVLLGDATGDRKVNVFDLLAIKAQINIAIGQANFRCDVTVDGRINVFDLLMVKNNLNKIVAPCP